MRKTAMFLGMLAIGFANAQQYDGKVGINNETPKATLEIQAYQITGKTKEGLLIPRLEKSVAQAMITQFPNSGNNKIEESTLIYVKDNVVAGDNAQFVGTGKGFYYFDAAAYKWTKLGTGGSGTTATTTAGISGATNGLAKSGNNVKLGGTLGEATTINQLTHNFTILGGDNQPNTVRFITDTHTQHNKAVYVKPSDPITGTNGNLREYDGENSPAYEKNDYMIILKNNKVSGKLELPEASDHKGRIIYLINGTTQGLNFSGTASDSKTPFNTSTLARATSVGYISNGVTWYPLGR